ncbi:DNA-binding MarR family transcriptional regulator [Olsenella profusa DSM 13989]|uniref:Putative organic hydroperoxide resistance transcriptional regulator n=1 Tax=Olsenella profusa F0195 TaxID=1125712 RepID=U2V499_9ACTN|nr:MarR family transcriptional regulator [Olsenella profusa]ERL07501.1 putative organic hydroperoxide resistance transcriptional regulator [Olsenella profusa F0195]MDP9859460.1 DNA-binding MarR family transcriptional regulator [Olsenella profusa DSM 13989]
MAHKAARSTTDDDLLLLDRQLCFPLYACSKEVVRRYAPLLEPLGLTYTQYIALMVVWEQGAITMHDLGKRLLLDSGTLTPLLRKLEGRGIISRERSCQDARKVYVRATDRGMELREQARSVPRAMGQCFGLTHEEADDLRRILKKVTHNMLAHGTDED